MTKGIPGRPHCPAHWPACCCSSRWPGARNRSYPGARNTGRSLSMTAPRLTSNLQPHHLCFIGFAKQPPLCTPASPPPHACSTAPPLAVITPTSSTYATQPRRYSSGPQLPQVQLATRRKTRVSSNSPRGHVTARSIPQLDQHRLSLPPRLPPAARLRHSATPLLRHLRATACSQLLPSTAAHIPLVAPSRPNTALHLAFAS